MVTNHILLVILAWLIPTNTDSSGQIHRPIDGTTPRRKRKGPGTTASSRQGPSTSFQRLSLLRE
jgi:hypothetical protein